MEKETKEKGKHSQKKITQFPTQLDFQEELEDAVMDRFLRQSIMEDADRIERELNEDPKLIGIGASDDLFGKIVEELKAKGIWEGDKEAKESDEDLDQKQGDLDKNEKAGTTVRANDLRPMDEKKTGDDDRAQKKENDTLPEADPVGTKSSSLLKSDRKKSKKVILQQTDDEKSDGNLLRLDKKAIQDHMQASTESVEDEISKNRNQDQEVDLEINAEEKRKQDEKIIVEAATEKEAQQKPAVYDMLSEADREALAFGYEMQKKEQVRKEKRKRRNRRLRYVSVAVVALVLVGGIGVSTEASRRWIFQIRDVVLENFGESIKNNFIEEEKQVRILNAAEEDAASDIKDKVGITPPAFFYLPEAMRFSFYEYDVDSCSAKLFYTYNDVTFVSYMCNNDIENVFYYQVDDALNEKEKIITEQDIEVQLYERKNKEEDTYLATFEYDGNYYYCSGMIPYEEMIKILKYLIIM